jgi:hypothetical protein
MQRLALTLRQVIPFVLGKDGQEEERQCGVVGGVDHPDSRAFPTRADTPATLADTPCADHERTVFRMVRNERAKVLTR